MNKFIKYPIYLVLFYFYAQFVIKVFNGEIASFIIGISFIVMLILITRKLQTKKEIIKNPVTISVTGIDPQTNNEFLFYDFIESEFDYKINGWYKQAKLKNLLFKPQYEKAVKQKIKTGKFKNPHSFPEYFNNDFDYIAIDFETANKNRVSVCAIGIVFIKGYSIVHKIHHLIKPPDSEIFSQRHINIHGITEEDVNDALNFEDLWNIDFVKYLNDNLVVFHNASMDLSNLKNLFSYYEIEYYNIQWIDTMYLAEKTGNPKKLVDLAAKFNINIESHHDPLSDAKVCGEIFNELIDIYPDYKKLIKNLTPKSNDVKVVKTMDKQKKIEVKNENKIDNENLYFIQQYALKKDELEAMEIEQNAFIFTGNIEMEREDAEKIILDKKGFIKHGISSKVDYVVFGKGFGWSKMQKIHKYNTEKGCDIKIMSEFEFKYLVDKS